MIGSFPISMGSDDLDSQCLDYIQSCLGDYLSIGNIFGMSETQVTARLFAAIYKFSESLISEFHPSTAVDMIRNWCNRIGIVIYQDDTIQSLRDRCSVKYKINSGGVQFRIINEIKNLLGNCLDGYEFENGIEWNYNIDGSTFDPISYATHSPYENPLPFGSDILHDDYQISDRCHFTIHVTKPDNITEETYYILLESKLPQILNWILPLWMTYDYVESDTGFIIAETIDDIDGSFTDFDGI
jgi:hypothetical protein